MLGEPGEIPPIPNSPIYHVNPLVGLGDVELEHEAIIVTHRHRGHFDDAAADHSRTTPRSPASPWRQTTSGRTASRGSLRSRTATLRGHRDAHVIDTHDPDAVVVTAGAAQFVEGELITVDPDDIREVREYVADDVPVVADHMEAIDHCLSTRADLAEAVDGVNIPDDGERVAL